MLGKRRAVVFVTGAALAALLAALLLLGSALAQTAPGTGGNAGPTNYREFFLDRLAAILGVDRSRLDGALKQAGDDTIGQAEKDGVLSQAQADRMRQFVEQGRWPAWGMGPWGFRHGGWFRHGWMKGLHGASLDAAAGALGLSRQELMTQLQDGKTLGQIADARGVDRQRVRDALVAAYKQKLDDAVKNGRLTQQQADRLLQQFQSRDLLDTPLYRCAPQRGSGGGQPQGTGTSSSL